MTERRARYATNHVRYFDACCMAGLLDKSDPASELEAHMLWLLHDAGLDKDFEREVRLLPGRKFSFDFASRLYRIAIEVQGGTFQNMGHSTGLGIRRDYEKSNLAQVEGWIVLHFDASMLDNGEAISMVQRAISWVTGCA